MPLFRRKISPLMLKKIVGKIWKKTPSSLRLKIVRATQRKFTVSVAAVITNENGAVLLLDHVLRPASSWGIPGGFIEPGEQPVDAVKRELYEETGIELTDVELLEVRTIARHVEIVFRAKAVGTARVRSREINALGWFQADEMPENMSRAQKSIAEKSLKGGL